MHEVSVLGVLDAKQPAVGRERATEKAPERQTAQTDVLVRTMKLVGRATVERDVQREAVRVPEPGDDDPGCLRQPVAPAVRDALEERSPLSSVEWLDHPTSGLVSGLVLEPQHAFAVERRQPLDESDRVVARLPRDTRLG